MKAPRETRCDVPSVELLRQLIELPLPLRLGGGSSSASHSFLRDMYLDSPDGRLHKRGITCRYRLRGDARQRLTVFVPPHPSAQKGDAANHEVDLDEVDPLRAVSGASAPARFLRGILDPELLAIAYAVHTERFTRLSERRLLRASQFQFAYDIASVERSGIVRGFQELRIRRLGAGPPRLARISTALAEEHGLRPLLVGRLERERSVAAALAREGERRSVASGRAVVLVALDRGTVACRSQDGTLQLPVADGSGEGACRHLLTECFGSTVGDLRLIASLPASDGGQQLEIWLARHIRHGRGAADSSVMLWLSLEELIARVGTGALRDRHTLAALLVVARSDLVSLGQTPAENRAIPASTEPPVKPPVNPPMKPQAERDDGEAGADDRLLDPDGSQIEFNARVLAMAEDVTTPLLERLQYLAIVSANNDEFFSVRVGALKRQRTETTGEHRIARVDEQLAAVGAPIRTMMGRQQDVLRDCLRELSNHGVRIVSLEQLDQNERAALKQHFFDVVFPALTPKAVTEAPGFPQPSIPSLSISFAVMVKDPQTGPLHLGYVHVPPMIARLIPVRDGRSFVLLDELIREHLDALYPGRSVLQAYLFRVTRSGELDAEESSAGDLLQAIEEDAKRRGGNAVVRVEVEQSMPATLRTTLLNELRFDTFGEPLPLGPDEVYEIDGPLDLTLLRQLAALPMPELRFPPLHPRLPFVPDRSIFAAVRERDRLVHHPYDDFATTVQRFIDEAADDPDVTTIKLTLYRAGERSPVVDALMRAALSGKEVSAFVELKARFDEARNVAWARRLGESGVHVVYGIVGLKNHVKMALVVRRESDALRRYVHVATGNYNAGTARVYTDLGLFSAEPALGADANDLFNELTGSSRWPRGVYRRLLVAPHAMLPAFLALIEREIEHARAGRPARIRLKLNGLSDGELIDALYRASQAGVAIDLIVRGLCRLRPGVPGLSENIRVLSILGRFLEHARIFGFVNGGAPEYFIGSADWRTRNVRRRVETVAPVTDPECRARLEAILERELNDSSAWELQSDGSYRRRAGSSTTGSPAQSFFASEQHGAADLAPA